MKSSTPSEQPKPQFDGCPLCGKPAEAYKLADTGLVRCWPCGLRLEKVGGLKVAAQFWNKRVNTIIQKIETPKPVVVAPVPTEKPTTLAEYVSQQVGGAWYVSDRSVKHLEKRGEKRIKKSDYERYKKLFELLPATNSPH